MLPRTKVPLLCEGPRSRKQTLFFTLPRKREQQTVMPEEGEEHCQVEKRFHGRPNFSEIKWVRRGRAMRLFTESEPLTFSSTFVHSAFKLPLSSFLRNLRSSYHGFVQRAMGIRFSSLSIFIWWRRKIDFHIETGRDSIWFVECLLDIKVPHFGTDCSEMRI